MQMEIVLDATHIDGGLVPAKVRAALVDRVGDGQELTWQTLGVSLRGFGVPTAKAGSLGTIRAAELRRQYFDNRGRIERKTSSGVQYLITRDEATRLLELCLEVLNDGKPAPSVVPGRRSRLSPLAAHRAADSATRAPAGAC